MKLAITIALAVLLSGCLFACTQLGAVKSVATDQIAGAADQALADSELILCRGITVGAWVRRYGNNPALAAAWQTLCGTPITQTPVPTK